MASKNKLTKKIRKHIIEHATGYVTTIKLLGKNHGIYNDGLHIDKETLNPWNQATWGYAGRPTLQKYFLYLISCSYCSHGDSLVPHCPANPEWTPHCSPNLSKIIKMKNFAEPRN